jgi:hypothetical protein
MTRLALTSSPPTSVTPGAETASTPSPSRTSNPRARRDCRHRREPGEEALLGIEEDDAGAVGIETKPVVADGDVDQLCHRPGRLDPGWPAADHHDHRRGRLVGVGGIRALQGGEDLITHPAGVIEGVEEEGVLGRPGYAEDGRQRPARAGWKRS